MYACTYYKRKGFVHHLHYHHRTSSVNKVCFCKTVKIRIQFRHFPIREQGDGGGSSHLLSAVRIYLIIFVLFPPIPRYSRGYVYRLFIALTFLFAMYWSFARSFSLFRKLLFNFMLYVCVSFSLLFYCSPQNVSKSCFWGLANFLMLLFEQREKKLY